MTGSLRIVVEELAALTVVKTRGGLNSSSQSCALRLFPAGRAVFYIGAVGHRRCVMGYQWQGLGAASMEASRWHRDEGADLRPPERSIEV